jgi:UDP-N-acetylmuramoyl-L-alanyl-D-glutamate--2,6-diaminopimelate ligase
MMAATQQAPWTLGELLDGFLPAEGLSLALRTLPISGLSLSAASVESGDVFIALQGAKQHGLAYAEQAVARGAAAILWEVPADGVTPIQAGSLRVPAQGIAQLRSMLGWIAARFYGSPSAELRVTAVTGTDGKTSVTHLLTQAWGLLGQSAAQIGTLGVGRLDALADLGMTTPDALTLQQHLQIFVAHDVARVVMEASSHALDQGRLHGTQIEQAIFTGLARDHLDYHGDEAGYAAAKQRLFAWPGLQQAILRAGDPWSAQWFAQIQHDVTCIRYGLEADADVYAEIEDVSTQEKSIKGQGLRFRIRGVLGEGVVQSALLGRFNVENLLAVFAALRLQDVPLAEALAVLEGVQPVPGRMQSLHKTGFPTAVVDYAHTPQALEAALTSLRASHRGPLAVVFGCGGERDRGKRALMGAVAERLADQVWLTNDNPRSEDPQAILTEILAGFDQPERAYIELDRAQAIQQALATADAQGLVLIAGKGHETTQQMGSIRLPFSDAAAVQQAFRHLAEVRA